MIISFDLDDTLIPCTKLFETEKQNLIQKVFAVEKIRAGTAELINSLKKQGNRIFIYTTSLRSIHKIRWTFFTYGITVDKIINHQIHNNTLKERAKNHSKFPPAFNIDFHVDDSPGLKIESERHNFKIIIVSQNDENWAAYILQTLKEHAVLI